MADDNLKITTELDFEGKKELQDLISDYKEFIRLNKDADKTVKNLANEIGNVLKNAVEDVNRELTFTPTDAYADIERNLKSTEKALKTSQTKIAKWSAEFDAMVDAKNFDKAEYALNKVIEWENKLNGSETLKNTLVADMNELIRSFQQYVEITGKDDLNERLISVSNTVKSYISQIEELAVAYHKATMNAEELSEAADTVKKQEPTITRYQDNVDYGDEITKFNFDTDGVKKASDALSFMIPQIKDIGEAMDDTAKKFGQLATADEPNEEALKELNVGLGNIRYSVVLMKREFDNLIDQVELFANTTPEEQWTHGFRQMYETAVAVGDAIYRIDAATQGMADLKYGAQMQDFVDRGTITQEEFEAIKNYQKAQEDLIQQKGELISMPGIGEKDAETATNAFAKVGQLKSELDELKKAGKGFGDIEYDEKYKEYILAKKASEDYRRSLERAALSQNTLDSSTRRTSNTLKTQFTNALTLAKKELDKLLKMLQQSVTNAFKSLSSHLKNIAKNFKLSGKGSSDLSKSLKRGLTTITKYVLGFRSLFFLVRRLRKAIKEGLDNLVQFERGTNLTNQRITELQASLLFLKNAWAAAVAPVLNVVIPILNILIDKIAMVGNAIASFFARLTGAETVIHAVKTEVGDYAESLDKSAGSSGKAAKAADKLKDRLAAFDDLNVLGKDDDSDKSPGSSGTGSPVDNLPDVNDMFKRVLTESKFADMVKEAIKSWDFSFIGRMLGGKLKYAISQIDWPGIQDKVTKGLNALITFINGFFTTPGLFARAGEALGHAFNILIGGIKQFFTDVEWYDIFKNIGEGLRAFIETIDVEQIKETLIAIKNAISEAFHGLLDGVQWEDLKTQLKQKLDEAFDKVLLAWAEANEGGVFHTVSLRIANKLATMLDKIPWDKIQQAAKQLATSIMQVLMGFLGNPKLGASMGNTIAGFANTLLTFIKTALEEANFTDIGETLGAMFTGLFTNLDFNSMKDIGSALPGKIQDFINGVLDGVDWDDVGNKLVDHVIYVITHLSDDASNIGKMLATPFKIIFSAAELIAGIVEGLGQALANAILKAVQDFNTETAGMTMGEKLWELTKRSAKALLKFFTGQTVLAWLNENIVGPIITSFLESMGLEIDKQQLIQKVTDFIQHPFESAKDAIILSISAIKPKITETWDNIKTYLSDNKGAIENFMKNPFKVAKEAISTHVDTMKTKVSDAFDKIKETVSQFGSAMWEDAKGGFSDFTQGVEAFINLIIDGFNKLISVLNELKIPINDTAKELGKVFKLNLGDSIGFNIKPLNHVDIPALAQGAVIPPNSEFLAMLGDQKHGTNIEAPLDTIKQALAEVMGNIQVENTGNAVMELDGQTFARLITPYVISELDRRGYDVKVINAGGTT